MNIDSTIELLTSLIRIPSVSGNEHAVMDFVAGHLRSAFGNAELLPVSEGRNNVLCSIGTPRIVFSTHLDVVPAPEPLFTPDIRDGRIYGRGACDAKGCAAAMVGAARALLASGATDFGLLFVVGEETLGDGARAAASALKSRGIRYLVNGEPTENKLATGHKGGIAFSLKTQGKSCHSGYPELGEDANRKLVALLSMIYSTDFGCHELLGRSTINVGKITAGTATNVVSDFAQADCSLRVVTSIGDALGKLNGIIDGGADIDPFYQTEPTFCKTLPDFETAAMSYGTDIPHFSALGVEALLYGPGSIHNAHTTNEFVTIESLSRAVSDYERIFLALHAWPLPVKK